MVEKTLTAKCKRLTPCSLFALAILVASCADYPIPDNEELEEPCNPEECWSLAGEWGVEDGSCPGVPDSYTFDAYPVTQDVCSLEFGGLIGEIVGESGCFDSQMISTSKGCRGHGLPTSMTRFAFECPGDEDDTCRVTLVMW
jgi:hypothetical protein